MDCAREAGPLCLGDRGKRDGLDILQRLHFSMTMPRPSEAERAVQCVIYQIPREQSISWIFQ